MQPPLPLLSKRTHMATARAIAAYLAAIVAANLIVAHLGPGASVITAFFLVGLDFTVMDTLHDIWAGPRLWRNMAALIGAGSLISYLANHTAGRIGLASFLAFTLSALVDRAVYALARHAGMPRWRRCNWSNIASTAADSILFPTLAFGFPPNPALVQGQFLAKLAGAMLWSLIILQEEGSSENQQAPGRRGSHREPVPPPTPPLQVRRTDGTEPGPAAQVDLHR